MPRVENGSDTASGSEERMALEEARQVRWVRPNQKPLGELLTAGILSQRDLQWAAARAYDNRLKEAATVILDAEAKGIPLASPIVMTSERPVQEGFSLNLTLEQARATPWPFKEYKGRPMGELLDSRLLSLRDLGFAVETAYEPRVKQAAMALMLKRFMHVVEEAPRKGAVSVISGGRSYMLRKQIELFTYLGFTFGAFLGAAVMSSVLYFVTWAQSRATTPVKEYPPLVIVLALLITGSLGLLVFFGFRWAANRLFNRFMTRINRHRRGQEGEDRVADTILPALDGEWTVFRNVVLPGRKYDLDMILAGPAGLWVLEIKAYQGAYRASGERWDRYSGGRWQKMPKSPGVQVATNAGMLSNFLKANGAQLWVEPVVVWANPESPLTLEEPNPQVWIMENLRDEVGNLFSKHAAKPEVIQQAVELLSIICEDAGRARAEEAGR